MQASLPQFIDAVKISDVGQGKHPVRIVSIRPLSDREKGGQTKSKREDRISQALNPDGRYWKATENRYIVSSRTPFAFLRFDERGRPTR